MEAILMIAIVMFSTVSFMGLDYLYSQQSDRLSWPAISFLFTLLVSTATTLALYTLFS